MRKITARRKNRREKGIRADLLGSKPHSKGEFFSRSKDSFLEIEIDTVRRIKINNIETTDERIIVFITNWCMVIKYEDIRVD